MQTTASVIPLLLGLLLGSTNIGMSANDESSSATPDAASGAVTSAPSTIADIQPAPGNSNLLVSQAPALDPQLRGRVMQYLNARSALLQDVSPDGKQVLIATRFASTAQLHVVERPMGARKQLTFTEEPISSGRFLPGTTSTIFYVQDVGGGEFHQIYRFDRNTGRAVMLTDGKSKHTLPVFSRDAKLASFTNNARNGRDTDVYVADVDSDATFTKVRRVTETSGTWAGLQFSPDGKRLLVQQFRAIDESDLHVLDVASGKMQQITPQEGKGSIVDAAFGKDGDTVYYVTDRYSDFNQLYSVHIGTNEKPKVLTPGIKWNVESLEVSQDGRTVAINVNEDGLSRIYLLDVASGKLDQVSLPAGILASMRFAPKDSNLLTFSIDAARSPADVWQLDVSNKKLTRWTESEVGGLDTSGFVEPELVRYKSEGGVEVPAFIYRPKAAAGKRSPVLVVFHGGPEGQSRPNFSPFVQLLVTDLGMAVLMPNVRGSDGYGKEYLAMDNGVKREESLKDIGATLDWIKSQPDLDANRVGVYGGSYGGYMVLATATFFPERIRAVVDVVGISNIVTFLKNTQDYRRDLRRAEYGDERIDEVRAVQERISPLNHVDKIQAHLFVQQGKNDPRVPQSEAEQIVKAVREKGRTCWYMLGLNEGHGFVKKENRDYALVATVQFLRETLLEEAKSAP